MLDFSLEFQSSSSVKSLFVESWFCNANSGFNCVCISWIICYYASYTVEMFHILEFFLYHNLYYGRLLKILIPLVSTLISTPQNFPTAISLYSNMCYLMTLLIDEIMKRWHVMVHWYNTATEQPQFSVTNWSQCHFAHCKSSDLDKNPVTTVQFWTSETRLNWLEKYELNKKIWLVSRTWSRKFYDPNDLETQNQNY